MNIKGGRTADLGTIDVQININMKASTFYIIGMRMSVDENLNKCHHVICVP